MLCLHSSKAARVIVLRLHLDAPLTKVEPHPVSAPAPLSLSHLPPTLLLPSSPFAQIRVKLGHKHECPDWLLSS